METQSQFSLLDAMRTKGLRLTAQRRVLVDVLEGAEKHLNAEEVYERARERDPSIHRATVYRTLNTLKKLRLVDELDLMHYAGDRHFYEIRPKAFHIHLVCTTCGEVKEPGGPFWEDLQLRVLRETGFRTDSARLEMGGTCETCRNRTS